MKILVKNCEGYVSNRHLLCSLVHSQIEELPTVSALIHNERAFRKALIAAIRLFVVPLFIVTVSARWAHPIEPQLQLIPILTVSALIISALLRIRSLFLFVVVVVVKWIVFPLCFQPLSLSPLHRIARPLFLRILSLPLCRPIAATPILIIFDHMIPDDVIRRRPHCVALSAPSIESAVPRVIASGARPMFECTLSAEHGLFVFAQILQNAPERTPKLLADSRSVIGPKANGDNLRFQSPHIDRLGDHSGIALLFESVFDGIMQMFVPR